MSVDASPVAPPGTAEANPHPLPQSAEPSDVMYGTRAVDFFQRRTAIVYQDRNGPCTFLAICNVLLLKGVITLDPDAGKVSQEKLLSLVAECLTNIKQDMDEGHADNLKQEVNSAIDLLPRLTEGIYMNTMFTKIDDFELTTQRSIFDLLDIPLYHGWIVDPQDTKTATAIGSKSYDALTTGFVEFKSAVPELHKRRGDLMEQDDLEKALKLSKAESGDGEITFDISHGHSSSTKLTPQSEGEAVLAEQADKTEASSPSMDDKATKWELIENFLKTNVTQLTAHGLRYLQEGLKDGELCVLFRNNHFSTMIKYDGRLYPLANDKGYIDKTGLVWLSLDEVQGGGVSVTCNFTLWMGQQANTSIDSLVLSDRTSGVIPSADPTDDKMSDTLSRAHGSKPMTFDVSVVYDLIVGKKWEDLDGYLSKFILTVIEETSDVVVMHPGLFMIPRMERLLDMLSAQEFDEASSFYLSSIEVLRGCQGRFTSLDHVRTIDQLKIGVQTRSMANKRSSAEEIRTKISDYIHLYFPSGIRRDDGPIEGLWQFAMRLAKPVKQGMDKKVYNEFRCLLCGWLPTGQHISHMRSHMLQSKEGRSCLKDLPSFECIKVIFSKKRKSALNNAVSWSSATNTSEAGKRKRTSTSQAGKRKRQGGDSSLSLDATSGQVKHQLVTSPEADKSERPGGDSRSVETSSSQVNTTQLQLLPSPLASVGPSSEDKVTNPLKMKVGKLVEETAAIVGCRTPSFVPDAAHRDSISDGVQQLQRALRQLTTYAQVYANDPAPEELRRIVGLFEEAADEVRGHITASVVPDIEHRCFLKGRVATVHQLAIEISYYF